VRSIASNHWLCGTLVEQDVAEDYDLSQGVAMLCPTCHDVWWHYPPLEEVSDRPVETVADAMEVEGAEQRDPAPASPVREVRPGGARAGAPFAESGHYDQEIARLSWPEARPATHGRLPALERREGDRDQDGPRLLRGWLAPALVLAGVTLIIIRLADVGPRESARTPVPTASTPAAPPRSAPARPAPARPTRRPRPAPRPAPPVRKRPARPAAAPTVAVRGNGFTIRRPALWRTSSAEGATVLSPRPGASVSLFVFSARRPDLSLEAMAVLARRTAQQAVPGGRVAQRPVRIGGRRGQQVTVARAGRVRRLTALAAGARRYVLDLRQRPGSPAAQRRLAAAAVRSFRAP